jgi:hypothetical protein
VQVLIVLTSHDELGDTGEKTGFWLEEFAAPYYASRRLRCRVLPRWAWADVGPARQSGVHRAGQGIGA